VVADPAARTATAAAPWRRRRWSATDSRIGDLDVLAGRRLR
jgi:hypothetical protein